MLAGTARGLWAGVMRMMSLVGGMRYVVLD